MPAAMAVQGTLALGAAMTRGTSSDALPACESMAMSKFHSPADSGAKTTAYSLGATRTADAGPSRSRPRSAVTRTRGS